MGFASEGRARRRVTKALAGARGPRCSDGRHGRVTGAVVFAALALHASVADAADPGAGKAIYEQHCVRCHGEDGRGELGGAPDFSRGVSLMQPDADIARTLRGGLGGMPAYEGLLRQDELLDVIAYVRSLQQ